MGGLGQDGVFREVRLLRRWLAGGYPPHPTLSPKGAFPYTHLGHGRGVVERVAKMRHVSTMSFRRRKPRQTV